MVPERAAPSRPARRRSRDDSGTSGGGAALLHRSERTLITRIPAPDGRGFVIRKEFRGPDATPRMRNEAAILRRLAGLDGIPELVDVHEAERAVLVTDTGGVPLGEVPDLRAPDLARVVRLARDLAGVLAGVHSRGVVHRDVNPANILVAGDRPILIDFARARRFDDEPTEFTHHREIAGTLDYLAPEQTGRTGRAVDHRADLYSLGATLYELVTARTPFHSSEVDPLALIHAHLTQVPTPPALVDPAVPQTLSAIVMRLLEKEPDQRYQSAEGVQYDLTHLLGRLDADVPDAELVLGSRDFPRRLTAPSQLVGRDTEISALRSAFSATTWDRPRLVLVGGAAGVGKTSLVDELRSSVTARGGWFVATKYDQYRQDQTADALIQGLRSLCRMLLAEPADQLAGYRERALAALGANAGLLAAHAPELATLLATPPAAAEDTDRARVRTYQSMVALLGAIASPSRPVVLVSDDLQWTTPFSLGAVDAILGADDLCGVLLVGVYRDTEVDAAHPLSAMLQAWSGQGKIITRLQLGNLPPTDVTALLARMLRVPEAELAPLAAVVTDRTGGNPYETVELLNALRRDGALVPEADGWTWDEAGVRGCLATAGALDLLTSRIGRIPDRDRRLLTVLACLGSEVGLGLLAEATGRQPADVEEELAPALEEGLLVLHRREGSGDLAVVRFRHDRVREAVLAGQERAAIHDLHLDLARRLAARPERVGIAAEQYLPCAREITDPEESRRAAAIFLAAADTSRITNGAAAEHYLTAATELLERHAGDDGNALLRQVHRVRHTVLCSLSRYEEADAVYTEIARYAGDLELAESACEQIGGLTNRHCFAEALALGLDLLARLTPELGDPRREAPVGDPLDLLRAWRADPGRAEDTGRPELADPRLVAAARVIGRLMPPAYFSDPAVMAWLVIRAAATWADRGPCADLVGAVSHSVFLDCASAEDRRVPYDVLRHVLAVAEARDYEPATSMARFHLSAVLPWFQPVENAVQEARRAREGLLRAGILPEAGFTYTAAAQSFLDCAPDLSAFLGLLESGLAFATRTGNRNVTTYLSAYRHLVRTLHDAPSTSDAPSGGEFAETAYLAQLADDPVASAQFHVCDALTSALLDTRAEQIGRTARALEVLRVDPAGHANATGQLLHALALAEQLHTDAGHADPQLLAALDRCREWLHDRSGDAPANFAHLVHLVDAERAGATGDRWAAAVAYEAALQEVASRPRPWHRALINERAARFHLRHGLEHTAVPLLLQARRQYRDWGATAKVRRLDEQYPMLRAAAREQSMMRPLTNTSDLSPESVDLAGILRASQALSRETHLARLQAKVAEILSAMTGATTIRLALRNDDAVDWLVHVPDPRSGPANGTSTDTLLPIEEAGRRGLVPLAAFRYVERTRELLRVDDSSRDEVLGRDPYYRGRSGGSVLAVPILSKGRPRAILLLENDSARAAFSPDRIDAVNLIAGQLAVSLDNALAERFRSLVQRSGDLTLVTHRTGRISYASGTGIDLLGYRHEPLIGQSVGDLIHPDDVSRLSECIRLCHPGRISTLECRLAPTDGASRWAEITFTDLTSDPAVSGVMLQLRDISERRRLEQELRHAQKLESVGQLASGIAHEINTPMQFVRDNLRFLSDAFTELATTVPGLQGSRSGSSVPGPAGVRPARSGSADDDLGYLFEEIPKALADALDGAERVAKIVRAMRVFGHPGVESMGRHDLNEAIRNTLVIATSEVRPVADVVEELGELPLVWCAIGDLNQVVLNLVLNAAHAMGQKLADTGERGTLTVRTRTDGDHVVIQVQDTGTGIPADIADRVFDPFFTTKEVGVGTGQGLALAHSLIHDHHHGTIDFTSTPGAGTTFTVRIPNPSPVDPRPLG